MCLFVGKIPNMNDYLQNFERTMIFTKKDNIKDVRNKISEYLQSREGKWKEYYHKKPDLIIFDNYMTAYNYDQDPVIKLAIAKHRFSNTSIFFLCDTVRKSDFMFYDISCSNMVVGDFHNDPVTNIFVTRAHKDDFLPPLEKGV